MELSYERWTFYRLCARRRWEWMTHVAVVVLIILMIASLLVQPYVFSMWLFVGFLLYSYNFIIILMPTTVTRMRPYEEEAGKEGRKDGWTALRLVLRNHRLALEMPLTLLLGAMLPMAWSFALIFGVTALFTVYYGFVNELISPRIAITVLVQIGFVFLIYALIYLLEPRSQGITRLTAIAHDSSLSLRSPMRTALIIMLAFLILLGLLTSLLGLWALLLPGITVQALIDALRLMGRLDIALFILVLVAQLMVLRHIQGLASRRMAVHLLALRIHALEEISRELGSAEAGEEVRSLRRRFLSIAIYDIVQHDLFGLMPIYMIGLREKYVLDESVLAELE